MKRLLGLGTMLAVILAVTTVVAAEKTGAAAAKAGLQPLNDFIGEWNGNGGALPYKPTNPTWKENINWGWKFKGDDAWMALEFKDSKYYKSGEVRFLPDTKKIQITMIQKDDKKVVFDGTVKDDVLTAEVTDKDKKESQQIAMNLAAEGIRMIFTYSTKPSGGTVWKKQYQVASNRAGESLAKGDKKKECVVSGGLGTMAVSFKGTTYYVCCTGCRDAFNENPEKYIKEFEASKKNK
jgi:hypothetical protein